MPSLSSAEEKIRILPESDGEDEGGNYQSINDGKVQGVFKTEEKAGEKSLLGIFLCVLSGFFMIGG